MAKLIMVAIKDRALNAFMRPFFAQTKGQAIRMFTDEINRPESEAYKHPDDYDLWYLGEWDDETGELHVNTHQENKTEQLAIGKNVNVRK